MLCSHEEINRLTRLIDTLIIIVLEASMANLKIINSPTSRIMTQCPHCQHVMKTSADTLYYLVECPSCTKDFVVRRFREIKKNITNTSLKNTASVSHTNDAREEAFIKNIYRLSPIIYKMGIGISLIYGIFSFGLNGNPQILFSSALFMFGLTILNYFILCAGSIYLRGKN